MLAKVDFFLVASVHCSDEAVQATESETYCY